MRLSDQDILQMNRRSKDEDIIAAPDSELISFACTIEAEVAERICVAVLDSCAKAAADNNDLRVYELMRGQAEAIRAAYIGIPPALDGGDSHCWRHMPVPGKNI